MWFQGEPAHALQRRKAIALFHQYPAILHHDHNCARNTGTLDRIRQIAVEPGLYIRRGQRRGRRNGGRRHGPGFGRFCYNRRWPLCTQRHSDQSRQQYSQFADETHLLPPPFFEYAIDPCGVAHDPLPRTNNYWPNGDIMILIRKLSNGERKN